MIKDIEPIIDIPDYSFYLLMIIIATILSVISLLFWLFFRKKGKDRFEIYLQKYKNIDFSDSKKAAYLITKYTNILAKNEKSKEIKERLDKDLIQYKYKKEVEDFSDETKNLYHLFLEIVTNE